ncbi:MAG: glycosyltransferase family 2 protein [Elusimicrobiota bacterium]
MKIVVVMPAYNAEKTLERTFNDIPKDIVSEIILVDDASKDGTVMLAQSLGIRTVVHDKNRGYGANQKTCYSEALKLGADIIVMIHPDYQYDARLLPYMVGFIEKNICDFMMGNRIRTRREALNGKMPVYKYIANRGLTILENILLGQNLGEFHSGYRAYKREVLEKIAWENNSDDFVFDQQILVQATYFGYRIGDVPVPARYFEEASSINIFRSTVYGLSTLWVLIQYLLAKAGIYKCKIFTSKK